MTYTIEERKAWREKLSTLSKQISKMTQADKEALALKCGTLTAEGHPLSAHNCCFLWAQTGRVLAQVGGFRQWQKAGRMVKAGEHACGVIYAPTKRKNEDGEETEDVRFLLVPVFDISQTEAM